MFTTNDGGVPGSNTPNEKAPGAANSKGLMTTNNSADFKSKIIAACAKYKSATGQYCLRKMTDWQGSVLFVAQAALGFYSMALALQIWRAFQQ